LDPSSISAPQLLRRFSVLSVTVEFFFLFAISLNLLRIRNHLFGIDAVLDLLIRTFYLVSS
jgi:hypothetical protein